jgi:hypothetical protein
MVGAIMIPHLNSFLDKSDLEVYGMAGVAVQTSGTVREAIVAVGGIDNLDDDALVAEANAVLDALPAEVDRQIMDALASAFARELPIHLSWELGDSFAVRITEEPHEGDTRVHIVFVSPDGRTLL